MTPIHTNPDMQHIDVRFYFHKNMDHHEMIDVVSDRVRHDPDLIEAYELVNDGFGRTVPADRPFE
jgi:hypothetical protein